MTTPHPFTSARHRVLGQDWPADAPTDPSLLPADISGQIFTIALLGAQQEGELATNIVCLRSVCRAWFDEVKEYFASQAPLPLSLKVGRHAFLCLVRREKNPVDPVTAGKKCALWFRSLHLQNCNEEQAGALLRLPGWKRAELGTTQAERFSRIRSGHTAEPDQVLSGRFALHNARDVSTLAQSLAKLPYGLELALDCCMSKQAPAWRLGVEMIHLVRAVSTCPNGAKIELHNLPEGIGSAVVSTFVGQAQLRLAEADLNGAQEIRAANQGFGPDWIFDEAQLASPAVAELWEQERLRIQGRRSPAKWPPPIELVFPRHTGDVVFRFQLSSSEQADLLLNHARCREALGESAAAAVDLAAVNQIRSRPDARNRALLFCTLEQAQYLHAVDLNLSRLDEKSIAQLMTLLKNQQHLLDCRLTKGRLRPYEGTQLASLVRGEGKPKALRLLDLSNTVIEGGITLAEAIADSSLTRLRITARRASPRFMQALVAGLGGNWGLDRLDVGWIAPGQLLDLVAAAPNDCFSGLGLTGRLITFRVPGNGLSVRVLSLMDPEFREIARRSICHGYKISPSALDAFLSDERNWSRFPLPSPDYNDDNIGYTTSLVPDETRRPEDSSDSEVSEDG